MCLAKVWLKTSLSEEKELYVSGKWEIPKSLANGIYAYTANINGNFGANYVNHGIVFWTPKQATSETVPVNQWYNTKTGVYAYSSNPSGNFGANYVNHGTAFSAYKSNNNDPELVSINQWYNTKSGVYAYTSNLSGNFGPYFVNHGEAFKTYK